MRVAVCTNISNERRLMEYAEDMLGGFSEWTELIWSFSESVRSGKGEGSNSFTKVWFIEVLSPDCWQVDKG